MLIGRWPSGAPMEPVRGIAAQPDPGLEDPSVVRRQVLDDQHINDFDYANDQGGDRVLRAAHIRKSNPRAEEPPGRAESNRHRLLRRGIPYGPEFQEGESPYGQVVPDIQDRGLLFLCYQASIEDGFEFVQQHWANTPDFPQGEDGRDPVISQDVEPRQLNLPGHGSLPMDRWVQTTGGGYFFAPSLSALRVLAGS